MAQGHEPTPAAAFPTASEEASSPLERKVASEGDELARGLHSLNNALHGMSLRLVLLRNDPDCMAKHEATVEALRRGIRVAAEEIERLEALLAERAP